VNGGWFTACARATSVPSKSIKRRGRRNMQTYDLIIRNGQIADGSGAPVFEGDVAIQKGVIAAIGTIDGHGAEEIDAAGCLVTPGFVDVHTHYDGQITWGNVLSPSSQHGVTTVVAGNCGVGFAPVRPGDRELLIKVMEGVEDIPEPVMAEGIPWAWESFPEYMDFLEKRTFDMDVAVQIAHSPLRVFVMGQRGADHEPATDEDRSQMAYLVQEAVEAGAIGVSTSRSTHHRMLSGELAPSVTSANEELYALARGLRAARGGVFQIVPHPNIDPHGEFAVMRQVTKESGRPTSFSLMEIATSPEYWRMSLDDVDQAQADGLEIRAQVFPRPVGTLFGLNLSLHPFVRRPSCLAIAHLPLPERVEKMRDPTFKARVLAEESIPDPQPAINYMIGLAAEMFRLCDPVDYAPAPDKKMGALAAVAGVSLDDYIYDALLEEDGHAVLYLPVANFSGYSLDGVRSMMTHPHTVLGLGDGGAHYGVVCDASYPTFALTHWARDAAADQRLPVEWLVAELTAKPANAVGLTDRGLLAPGMKADINIIDHARLKLLAPRVIRDLPNNGKRLVQAAEGYSATIVSGVVTYRDGQPSGQFPGRLVRANSLPKARAA
jgi:N-acyl-D-amino-acid deacylase